jgi:hypothetical protein
MSWRPRSTLPSAEALGPAFGVWPAQHDARGPASRIGSSRGGLGELYCRLRRSSSRAILRASRIVAIGGRRTQRRGASWNGRSRGPRTSPWPDTGSAMASPARPKHHVTRAIKAAHATAPATQSATTRAPKALSRRSAKGSAVMFQPARTPTAAAGIRSAKIIHPAGTESTRAIIPADPGTSVTTGGRCES